MNDTSFAPKQLELETRYNASLKSLSFVHTEVQPIILPNKMGYIATYEGVHIYKFQAEYLTIKQADWVVDPFTRNFILQNKIILDWISVRAKFRYVWTKLNNWKLDIMLPWNL